MKQTSTVRLNIEVLEARCTPAVTKVSLASMLPKPAQLNATQETYTVNHFEGSKGYDVYGPDGQRVQRHDHWVNSTELTLVQSSTHAYTDSYGIQAIENRLTIDTWTDAFHTDVTDYDGGSTGTARVINTMLIHDELSTVVQSYEYQTPLNSRGVEVYSTTNQTMETKGTNEVLVRNAGGVLIGHIYDMRSTMMKMSDHTTVSAFNDSSYGASLYVTIDRKVENKEKTSYYAEAFNFNNGDTLWYASTEGAVKDTQTITNRASADFEYGQYDEVRGEVLSTISADQVFSDLTGNLVLPY